MTESEQDSRGWNYYEAGVDTIGEVPPVGDSKDLQRLLEQFESDAEGEKKDAYQDAAELVEAHRIRKMHNGLTNETDRIGNFALMGSLFLAGGAGAVLPLPDVQADAGLQTVFASILDTIASIEYALAFVLFAAAIILQIYGSFRLERGEIGK